MSTSNTFDTISTSPTVDSLKDTHYVFENEPLPLEIPLVDEIGATTAPLISASYYIGARCQPYNDDFMLCQQEANGKGPIDCLKEGRRVTRCAASVIKDLNENCSKEFRLHWRCLGLNNLEYKDCRTLEKLLDSCVFNNLKLKKRIPGVDEKDQIHLKKNPIYKPYSLNQDAEAAFVQAKLDGKL